MLHRIRLRAVSGGAAITLAMLAAATPAAAASPPAGASATSPTISGYALERAPAMSSASATFTVPALTCTNTLSGSVGVGAYVFTNTGSVSASNLFVICFPGSGRRGLTVYEPVLVINGSGTTLALTPKAGDSIITSVSVSATATTVSLRDVTQHFFMSLQGAGATPATVLVGTDALTSGQGVAPVPEFGTIPFSAGRIDGMTLAAAGGIAVDRVSSAHRLQVMTGALNAAGNAFTESFRHR